MMNINKIQCKKNHIFNLYVNLIKGKEIKRKL